MLKNLTVLIFSLILALPAHSSEAPDFSQELSQLTQKKFKKKVIAIDKLFETKDERLVPIFEAMLEGKLYYTRSDKEVIITEKTEEGYQSYSALNNSDKGVLTKKQIKKIKVNNNLRRKLRGLIAELSLTNPDLDKRMDAVKNLRSKANIETIALLSPYLEQENDSEVKALMQETLDIARLNDTNTPIDERTNAARALGDSLSLDARNALQQVIEQSEHTPEHQALISVATQSLKSIESSLDLYSYVETAFFGLSMGSVLLLAAIGLAITFGVMGVINMAHGEMIMIGAYTTYVIQLIMPNLITLSIWVAIPMAFIVAGLVGILMERLVIRHLYGRPLETLLATFGISLILQQLVRTIFSPLNKEVITPEFLTGTLQINEALSITYNRLYIIIFSIIVFLAVLYIMKKTTLGLQVRAVTQNREMAKAMGINTDRIDMITFGLGSGLAGIAGVALSQLTNVGPNLGQAYIIDSFMVVVFGGVGNLWGTFIAAFTLGELNKFIEPLQGAVLAKVIILIFIILFIQKRPRGLFPQKGRDAES